MRDRRRETETQKARNSRMKMLALCQFVPFSSNTMAPLFPDSQDALGRHTEAFILQQLMAKTAVQNRVYS